MEILKINNTIMPPIAANGLNISRNKIWSADTGRTESGDMVGTILKIKTKYEINFVPLTQEQVDLVDSVISSLQPFSTCNLTLNSGKTYNFTIYSGDITYPMYMDAPGKALYNGVKVSLIEK